MDNSIRDFVQGIPPVTRFLFLGTLGVTVIANMDLISPMLLVMDHRFYDQLQVRPAAVRGGKPTGRVARG